MVAHAQFTYHDHAVRRLIFILISYPLNNVWIHIVRRSYILIIIVRWITYLNSLNSEAQTCCWTKLFSPLHVTRLGYSSFPLLLFSGFIGVHFYHLLKQILWQESRQRFQFINSQQIHIHMFIKCLRFDTHFPGFRLCLCQFILQVCSEQKNIN